jgi:RHS repeat-associated protein
MSSIRIAAAAASVLLWFSTQVGAQQAPTGDHYAGRPSDTGVGGTQISPLGGFSSTVPLELPRERASLPLPIEISYSGHGTGAAGFGWDIPLSYIQDDLSFAHRRPLFRADTAPQARRRTYLALLGAGGELVEEGDHFALRTGTRALTVRKSQGVFYAYDGGGRTYVFKRPVSLGNTGLWLLDSIATAGNATVQLSYDISSSPIAGSTGIAIDLVRLTYNTSPLTNCGKNEIVLTYGAAAAAPLSMSMELSTVLVRFHTLEKLDVLSRASCATPLERLRRYQFAYVADADTRLPRLDSVRMFGRQGTAEEGISLPISSYQYASASTEISAGHRVLEYQPASSIALPSDDADAGKDLASSVVDGNVAAPVSGEKTAMWQDLVDIDGDGRPDLIFKKAGKLSVAMNRPAAGGTTSLTSLELPLQDATFSNGPISTQTSTARRLWYGSANTNVVNVWRQAIDVDGDGRMDIVDAGEEAGHWVVYLNTPNGPNGIKWVRRSLSIRNLLIELRRGGHVLEGDFLPLSRRSSGVSVATMMCLDYDPAQKKWVPHPGGTVHATDGSGITYFCAADGHVTNTNLPPPPPPVCIAEGCAPAPGVERTFIEWELLDLNGDGYPDFVFNSRPVEFAFPPPTSPPNPLRPWVGDTTNQFQLRDDSQMRAAFNIVGVHLDTTVNDPLSRTFVLGAQDSDNGSGGATIKGGVGMWQSDTAPDASGRNVQRQLAGFADINGDGLIDRVLVDRAYLGTYVPAAMFSPAYLTLPNQGRLSEQRSTQSSKCASGPEFTSSITRGIRDLTGDGIPDFFDNGKVAVGTGAGFVTPMIDIKASVSFVFSHQTESCHGGYSRTDGGLFDLDGDGKPAILGLVGDSSGNRLLAISRLVAPAAGRLIGVDNGTGASTQISYISAKEDLFTSHQVPFPEIVVSGIKKIGNLNLGGSLAGTRYAYGDAHQIFDPTLDRFTFLAYGRTVQAQLYTGRRNDTEAMATIVDSWPLEPFSSAMTKQQRWLRQKLVGQPRNIYAIRGSEFVGPAGPATADPWPLLKINIGDARIIGMRHLEWDAKLFELPTNTPDAANFYECTDMVDPYDFSISAANAIGQSGLNPCLAFGFVFSASTRAWLGTSPPPSTDNVQTFSKVLSADDFGRITAAEYDNDVFRSDDDICIETQYASPTASYPRVLTAIASRRSIDCNKKNAFASESFFYDNLPAGSVSSGHVTSHVVDRRAPNDGVLISAIRTAELTYDPAGNVRTITSLRNGAQRKVAFVYDPFEVVPIKSTISATSIPAASTSIDVDPISLNTLFSIDAYQVRRGTQFDGFGRLSRSTLQLPGGIEGIIGTTRFDGFDGADPLGPRISMTHFQDPVPAAMLTTAQGHTATMYLDEMQRPRLTELELGADYANEKLILASRTFDDAGRVAFEAQPYPASEASPHYGSTYYYKNTGDLDCVILGSGIQAYTATTDLPNERLPTCFEREYANHTVTDDVRDPASLQVNSPQFGVAHRRVTSAIGRMIEHSDVRATTRLDYSSYVHDQLGHVTSMIRYLDPIAATGAVQWSWKIDSLGQVMQVSEPGTADRLFDYSDWGEITTTRWMDGLIEKSVVSQFDAASRLVHKEERIGGVQDPATVSDFTYDVPASPSPMLQPTFLRGRLSAATSASGITAFSYDALGHMNARAFKDELGVYINQSSYHSNGDLAALTFRLPDSGYAPETVSYTYDSAVHLRSIQKTDASGTKDLYQATNIDPLGHLLKGVYGANSVFTASYAPSGRRLMSGIGIQTPAGSRQLQFAAYDGAGRATTRSEFANGSPVDSPAHLVYDPLGRLAAVFAQSTWKFAYDALGNLVTLADSTGNQNVVMSVRPDDPDRICRVEFGTHLSATACNVDYDAAGSMTNEPTHGGTRQFEYFPSGATRTIAEGNSLARFAYDAFGTLQRLDIQGPSPNQRHDRQYGLISSHEVSTQGAPEARIFRSIPGPGGVMATQRGPGADWVYHFGELRGGRFFTNDEGKFVQEVSYSPFGIARSKGAQPGALDYTNEQWNGGAMLGMPAVVSLGARIYDPLIGRFTSRDPVMSGGGAAAVNPYAFARNDPIYAADPTGLDCIGENCEPLGPLVPDVGPTLAAVGSVFVANKPAGGSSGQSDGPTLSNAGSMLVEEGHSESAEGASGFALAADVSATASSTAEKILHAATHGPVYGPVESLSARRLTSQAWKRFAAMATGENMWLEEELPELKSVFVLKWAGRGLSVLDLTITMREYQNNPTGDNEGKVILSGVKAGLLEIPSVFSYAGVVGITLGEENYDMQQAWEERLPYLEGRINRLGRNIDALMPCPLYMSCADPSVDDRPIFGPPDRPVFGPPDRPVLGPPDIR